MSRNLFLWIALAAIFGSACSHRHLTARVPAQPPTRRATTTSRPRCCSKAGQRSATVEQVPRPGYTEVGYASWYGDPYHGRRAADGEIYDKYKLTAAHRTLPFGTRVKVTDLENNRSVKVRINDRGPFVKGRIVDLSLAAARALRMVGPGTALVRLEVLRVPTEPDEPAKDKGGFAVQVGAFRRRKVAERLQKRLLREHDSVIVQKYKSTRGVFYRVRVGPKPSLAQANQLASRLQRERLDAFVVRVNN